MSKHQIDTPQKREIIDSTCAKFPDASTRSLARKLFNENPELFSSLNSAQCAIRFRRGAMGNNNRARGLGKFTRPLQLSGIGKYTMPKSKEEAWLPFKISTRKNLILSDVHIPYHNIPALEAAINLGVKRKPDCIILNGDTADFYGISRFLTDPKKRNLKDEVELTKQFLGYLRTKFPKARIIYKLGNHDERWEHFIWSKAAELWDLEIAKIEVLLEFEKFGVEIVRDQRIIRLGKLDVLHGHEFPKGLTNSVNPARGNFLRGLECSLAGHLHRTSEHAETSLSGRFITCWSTGCLCELNPAYARINKWNHGFAWVELAKDGMFNVESLRILNGKIL